MSIRIPLAVCALGAGCLASTDDVELAPDTSETTSTVIGDDEWGCPKWGCGTNSPVIDAMEFHELSEIGEANRERFKIDWFRKGATYYRPDVMNASLYARNSDGSIALSGTQLVGSVFRVSNTQNGKAYILSIASSSRYALWARPNGLVSYTMTYKLNWVDESKYSNIAMVPWTPVCNEPTGNDTTMGSYDAVMFEDDRIDADAKVVYAQTRNWFNIGCAGHALAKQHLTGHTKAAGELLAVSSTLDERTANLKMIVADYCGNGTTFTQAGIPLHWRDENSWYNTLAFGDTLEARWSPAGATCLNTPRLVEAGFIGARAMETEIAERCKVRPPACSGTTWTQLAPDEHTVSAAP